MEKLRSLIALAQTDDLDAYGTIVRRFQDMAVGYAYSVLGDFHWAQDAAQEAFIEAYRHLPQLREPAAFASWFRKIVFKHCDRLTRGRSIETVPLQAALEIPSGEGNPAEVAEEKEMKDSVLSAIRALPERDRIVTTLFYINGYSYNEIADFLEIPMTTVDSRLQSSRRRIQERMLKMVKDNLQKHRPSRDEQFANTVQLFNAAEMGQLQKAKELLSNDPGLVNVKNSSGQTPLHVAAYYGYKDMMELLLADGAAVDARDKVDRTPLHHMVQHCVRPEVAELLLVHGAEINARDNMGTTPASLAVYYEMKYGLELYNQLGQFLFKKGALPDIFLTMQSSKPEEVEALLKADPTLVNARMKEPDGAPGATPLHFAVSRYFSPNNRRMAEILLQYGADINALDDRGRPPLYFVWFPRFFNDRSMAEFLLAHGAELNIFSAAAIGRTDEVTQLLSTDPILLNATDAGGNTPLNLAAWKRELEMVELLLAKGADPNPQNKYGQTPVSLGLIRGSDGEYAELRAREIGHLLIKHGAKCDIWTAAKLGSVEGLDACLRDDPTLLNAPNDDGLKPLHLASFSWGQDQSAMEFLLEKGAALDICTAVQLGKQKQIENLIDADPTLVNTRTVVGQTPLTLAAFNGDEAMVRYLVERGAAIDAKNPWWASTPLLQAGEQGHKPIVEFLIEQGADINARNKQGTSLLHLAVRWADTEFVRSLVSRGADINVKDVEYGPGGTPTHTATWWGKVDLVRFFLEQGIDINDVGIWERTPLLIATLQGHTTLVRFLLGRGANVSVKSCFGETPLQLAMKNGDKDAVALLRQHGATE